MWMCFLDGRANATHVKGNRVSTRDAWQVFSPFFTRAVRAMRMWKTCWLQFPRAVRASLISLLTGDRYCAICGGSIRVRLGLLVSFALIVAAFMLGLSVGRSERTSLAAHFGEAAYSQGQPWIEDDQLSAELKAQRRETIRRMTERTSRGKE